jgi:hypothetical protein
MVNTSNGNDIETKAERSFDLDFVFDIEAIKAKRSLFIPQILKNKSERTLFIPQIEQIKVK